MSRTDKPMVLWYLDPGEQSAAVTWVHGAGLRTANTAVLKSGRSD